MACLEGMIGETLISLKKIIWKHGLGLQSWTDETTVEMFGHNAATPPAQTPLPTVKHGGGEVMIWVYFAATRKEVF